jgi:hypothetical protein
MADVNPSSITAAGTQAGIDNLWALRYLFTHNWSKSCVLETSFQTAIEQAINGAEQRWGLIDRPNRSVKGSFTVHGRGQVAQIKAFMGRFGEAKALIPVYMDECRLSDPIEGSGVFNFKDDPLLRHFCLNGRVVLAHLSQEATYLPSFEVAQVLSPPFEMALHLDAALEDWGDGDVVFPLMECLVSLETQSQFITDSVATFAFTAAESLGPSTLKMSTEIGAEDDSEQLGYPVFRFPADWSGSINMTAARTGSYAQIGRGETLEVFGDRPVWKFDVPVLQMSRLDSWTLLAFFEGRAGRLLPFWFTDISSPFTCTSVTNTTVVVATSIENLDWTYFSHLAIELNDGSVLIREISSVSSGGGFDTVTVPEFDSTPSFGDICRVVPAYLVRFDTDALQLSFETINVCSASLPLVEVLNEASIEFSDLTILPSGDQTELATEPAGIYANLITFEFLGQAKRYITFNQEWTDGTAHLFEALPSCEIDFRAQSGAVKDEPIEIRMPAVSPFDKFVNNESFGYVVCTVEEMEMLTGETTRRTVFKGSVGMISYNDNGKTGVLKLTVKGLKDYFVTGLGIPAENLCPWSFGGRGCNFDLSSIRNTVTVLSVDDRTVQIDSSAHATPYYVKGYATYLGQSLTIRSQPSPDILVFNAKVPLSWVGQSVVLTPGCNKTKSDCKNKWNNESQFGGCGILIPSFNPLFEYGD